MAEKKVDINPGTFIGYTLGGAKPTLYFENGHYTQVHGIVANIGWHPIKGDKRNYRGANISPAASVRFSKLDFSDSAAFGDFVNDFLDGKLDDNVSPTAQLFEYSIDEKNRTWVHLSRAKLVPADKTYDANYAAGVIKVGVLAPNES